ncbi:MAG: helix-turn-helix transcriptional regulator [Proteobacteria bacterium]|nr:helix-turn-helix transcriptional regulator [Pseudomonadota bacterium]
MPSHFPPLIRSEPRGAGKVGISLKKFSELTQAIADGAFESPPLGSALPLMRDALQVTVVSLTIRSPLIERRALMIKITPRGVEVIEDAYTDYWGFYMDPFVGMPADQVVTMEELVGESRWLTSDYYRQFLEPYGARYVLGAEFRTPEGVEGRFRLVRLKDAKPFSASDKALCAMLLPHLRCAVRVLSRLDLIESERKLYAHAIDRLHIGTLLLDETGAVVKMNEVAQEIVARKDGLGLSNGALRAAYENESRELQRMVHLAITGVAESAPGVASAMSLTRPSGATRLGVVVRTIPISEWTEGKHRPVVAVMVRDADRKAQAAKETMRQLFGFTPMESALALQVADGLTLEEAADRLHVSKNTVRAHLRSIFTKTGVTRQTALVHLLLSSVFQLG